MDYVASCFIFQTLCNKMQKPKDGKKGENPLTNEPSFSSSQNILFVFWFLIFPFKWFMNIMKTIMASTTNKQTKKYQKKRIKCYCFYPYAPSLKCIVGLLDFHIIHINTCLCYEQNIVLDCKTFYCCCGGCVVLTLYYKVQ